MANMRHPFCTQYAQWNLPLPEWPSLLCYSSWGCIKHIPQKISGEIIIWDHKLIGEAKTSICIMSEWQWMSLWKCWISFSAMSSRLRNLQRLGLERGESQHGLHQWWITFQVASNPHQEFVSKHAGAGSHAGIAMQLPVKLSCICIHLLNCFKLSCISSFVHFTVPSYTIHLYHPKVSPPSISLAQLEQGATEHPC